MHYVAPHNMKVTFGFHLRRARVSVLVLVRSASALVAPAFCGPNTTHSNKLVYPQPKLDGKERPAISTALDRCSTYISFTFTRGNGRSFRLYR